MPSALLHVVSNCYYDDEIYVNIFYERFVIKNEKKYTNKGNFIR